MKKGIVVAGCILVDKINEIDAYPHSGELTKILRVEKSVGGCVPNVAVDLKRIDSTLNVQAVGKIGNDVDGAYVRSIFEVNGVETDGIVVGDEPTSFTQVMSIRGGQRTFFTYAGANDDFGYSDVDFSALNAEMLHLGYLLLMKKMDNGDGERLLREAQQRGIKTSIDLVSENADRYKLVLPCLKYVDNVIVNEMEAGGMAGLEPTPDNMRAIVEKIKRYGVKDRVIVHMPMASVCFSDNGYTVVPSYDLPKEYIRGTTGAGDAFCAGSLIGIYRGWTDEGILSFATAAATAALSETNATSGIRSEKEIKEFCGKLKRRTVCL